jgi:hypothetical protein
MMIPTHRKAFSALALFLVFSLTQVYVRASLVVPGPATPDKEATLALAGRLLTSGGNLVILNGNNVGPGATVLSGAELQTTQEAGAIVQLNALGTIEVAPNSSLTLTFDESSVDVVLHSGNLVLTTLKGINGSVTNSLGKVVRTDASTVSSVTMQNVEHEGIGGEWGAAGARTFGLLVLAGGIATTFIWFTQRGDNPSPSTFPR